ncbi:MAG: hypothetical protein IPL61_03390 [Myxococcales bacterium]|nr:hypothetical protein [Myxococcales bacterium]
MTTTVLPPWTAVTAIGRLSLKRLVRGKALWIAAALALLPMAVALIASNSKQEPAQNWAFVHLSLRLTLLIVPPILVGASLADDIGEKSAAYLWSRPLQRWTILVGKLVYLVPIVIVLSSISTALAWVIARDAAGVDTLDLARTLVGVAATSIAASTLTVMAVVLAPRFGVVIAMCWLLTLDVALGGRAIGARVLATSFSLAALAEGRDTMAALVSAAVISLLCLTVALRRVDRIE